MSAAQALLHEILLALVGHAGDLIRPTLVPIPTASTAYSALLTPAVRWRVVAMQLAEEVRISDAERHAIDEILKCGYHYTSILAFIQSVDAGATLSGGGVGGAAGGGQPAKLDTVADNVAAIRRLDAQQSRSVYSAASQMLSPRKPRLNNSTSASPDDEATGNNTTSASEGWMMVASPAAAFSDPSSPKSVGLYLRALVLGLDEMLNGYRTLVLRIEQEILSESALDPASAEKGGRDRVVIDFGLTKLTLMLRQYAVILPALHDMIQEITAAPTNTPAASGSAPPSTIDSRYSTHSIHGCSLLSFLHTHSQTGVPLLSGVYTRLLTWLDRVMMQQVIQWCFEGIIIDPFEEFWIRNQERLTTTGSKDGSGPSTTSSGDAFTGFDTLQYFRTRSGNSNATEKDTFDWDTSFLLLPSLLPLAYFPSSSLTHAILFCGKAVRVLQQGEAGKGERRRRREARERRRRIVGVTAGDSNSHLNQQYGLASTKNRRTASMAGLAGLLTPKFASSTAKGESLSLAEECAPLLQQFHALRQSSSPFTIAQSDSSSLHSTTATSSAPSAHSHLSHFESLTTQLSSLLSHRLYTFLLSPPQGLLVHLDHLRRFVLATDAAFVCAFVEGARETLGRQPTARTEKDLAAHSGPLKTALREALQAGEDEDGSDEEDEEGGEEGSMLSSRSALALYPLKHLSFSIDSSLATPASGASGPTAASATASSSVSSNSSAWRLLKVDYSVSSPLNLILTPAILSSYSSLFRFLLQARRVQLVLREMWLPCQSMQGGWRTSRQGDRERMLPTPTSRAGETVSTSDRGRTLSFQLLRANMSFLVDTLNAYVQIDVVQRLWNELVQKIGKATDFTSIRTAHEEYLSAVTGHCFLRDRVVSGALNDLFETCLQFHKAATTGTAAVSSVDGKSASSPPPGIPPQAFARLSAEWDRQSCFLFTVLSRKTDFTGGASSFLHALVSRLDFNGYYTQVSRDLGLNKAGKQQLVPQQKGTVLSQQGIQSSLARPTGGSSSSTALTVSSSSVRPSSSLAHSTADLVSMTQHLTRAPASSFVPSHLHTTSTMAAGSHAVDFAYGSTRPASARNATQPSTSAFAGRRPQSTRNAAPSDEPTSY